MRAKLNILMVEDSEDDALLVLHQIKKGNYIVDYKRVESAETMKSALMKNHWDIILSDYQMPNFSGLEALSIVKESGLDLPFIIISGAIGEEVAVQAMKAGAYDYIMKDNLQRLLPVVERELKEFNIRKERKQLEKKQKAAEERYRLIAENTADTITVLDLNFKILYVSPSVLKLRGYTVEETISGTIDHFLTPKSLEKAKKTLAEQLDKENYGNYDPNRYILLELEEIHKNGTIIQVELSVSFIRDEDQNPIRILVVSRDITKRKQAEEKLKVLSHAVEQNPVMILITDTKGNIEYVNPKFEEVTGYSLEETMGKNPSILNSGKNSDNIYKDMWNTIKSHKVWHGELINKRKNNELYWANITISPITDNMEKVTHFVSIQEDITEKKKIEKELICAKERAEESDRLKTAFLQNMSHEIRTPMNAIIGFSDLFVSVIDNKEELQKYIKIMQKNCYDLLDIINDILEMAKIDSRQLPVVFQECDLQKLFYELELFFNSYKTRIDKPQIEFSLNKLDGKTDLTIKTDLAKLKQILINLISNAFKFTDEGKISGGYKYDENKNIVFFISDTGIGIPPDKKEVIFQRFIKLNQNKTKFQEGTGLGLSIVKELIDLLGGKIWLESEPFKGSTFYFIIPCQIMQE